MTEAAVRGVSGPDFEQWRDLWIQYLEFYESATTEADVAALWARVLDSGDPVRCLIAEVDLTIVGIVQFFPHADTWRNHQVCYLQDLFVGPGHRRSGIGKLLIRSVAEYASRQGWAPVYWQTADDNHEARSLYDGLTGGPSGFIVYELEPGPLT